MLKLIKDLERGDRGDLGVGVLNENIDPLEERFGEGSPSNSGESLEVVLM